MMVQINRMAKKPRSEMQTVAGRNRCRSQRRVNSEGLEGAHNGVRGDVVVEVSEQRH